jgi:hypothetical protein
MGCSRAITAQMGLSRCYELVCSYDPRLSHFYSFMHIFHGFIGVLLKGSISAYLHICSQNLLKNRKSKQISAIIQKQNIKFINNASQDVLIGIACSSSDQYILVLIHVKIFVQVMRSFRSNCKISMRCCAFSFFFFWQHGLLHYRRHQTRRAPLLRQILQIQYCPV